MKEYYHERILYQEYIHIPRDTGKQVKRLREREKRLTRDVTQNLQHV